MHSGTGKAWVPVSYPVKYSNEPFLQHESFLENFILPIPVSSILIHLCFYEIHFY